MITFTYKKMPTIDILERDAILQALIVTKGNKRATCRLLGLCIRTLQNKINSYGFDGLKGDIRQSRKKWRDNE